MDSTEQSAEVFERFVGTFTSAARPEFVAISGGEPLLRPALIRHIAEACHAVGTRVSTITGMYFARPDGKVPTSLWSALTAVDHVVASLDVYHEAEVPRAAVLATMRSLHDAGRHISFQVSGNGADDPYIAEVTGEICETFDNHVPIVVTQLNPIGRARTWLPVPSPEPVREQPPPRPCTLSNWPVVTYDGTIVACCNQEVIDGPPPDHLVLGNARTATWGEVAERCRMSSALRAVRTMGPQLVRYAYDDDPGSCSGYCATCKSLGDRRELLARLDEVTSRPAFGYVERQVRDWQQRKGAEGLTRRWGIPAYAELSALEPATGAEP